MTTKFTVRAPDELMERLRELAGHNRRSVHAELLVRLEQGVRLAVAAERREVARHARQAQG
jgi:predicted transcriptional regulator